MNRTRKHFKASLVGIMWVAILLMSCSEEADLIQSKMSEATTPLTETNQVSTTTAVEIADNFNSLRYGSFALSSRGGSDVQSLTDSDGNGIAYVVNRAQGGWVIVSANKDYYPILAYSDSLTGRFEMSDDASNSGIAVWLSETAEDMGNCANYDDSTTSAIAAAWRALENQSTVSNATNGLPTGNSPEAVKCRERLKQLNETYYTEGWKFTTLPNVSEVVIPDDVYSTADWAGSPEEYTIVGLKDESTTSRKDPLLSTHWNQRVFADTDKRAGCVAIAIAQIMYFYRNPSYFKWGQMYVDSELYNEAQEELIIDIRKNLGLSGSATKAKPNKAIEALNSYGYYASKKDHRSQEAINELVSNHPFLMFGRDNKLNEGHAWVCDGYTRHISEYRYYVEYLNSVNEYVNYGMTLMENPGYCSGLSYTTFHMNWGWRKRLIDGELVSLNGWFMTPKPADRDYSSDRENIYTFPI